MSQEEDLLNMGLPTFSQLDKGQFFDGCSVLQHPELGRPHLQGQ